MNQNLNNNVITAPELAELRKRLRKMLATFSAISRWLWWLDGRHSWKFLRCLLLKLLHLLKMIRLVIEIAGEEV